MIVVGDGATMLGAQDASIPISPDKMNVTKSQRDGAREVFLLMKLGHRSTAIFRASCCL